MLESTKRMSIVMYMVLFIIISINISKLGVTCDSFTSSYLRTGPIYPDLPLDSEYFAPPKGHNAPQQVHITQGDYDGKAIIISWVTPNKPGDSRVYYGPANAKYKYKAKGDTTTYSFNEYKSGFIHHCLVDGLEYNTKYYYKIGSGRSAREFWFQTPPAVGPDSSYTFGIIGDLGQTNDSWSTLQHYMMESKGEAVLFMGDLTYADWYAGLGSLLGLRWDSWGRLVEPSFAYQPWIWCTGNHDVEPFPEVGLTTTFKQFSTRYPTPYMASNSSEPLWYAIRRASAHIIVLSSYSGFVRYTPQYAWLEAELGKVDRKVTPWLIVIMHVPMYNTNVAHYMEGEAMRSVFEKWFISYKVDVVFAGHVHSYERSHRVSNIKYNISNSACTPVLDKTAPMYINLGDGGNSEGVAGDYLDPQPKYSAFREGSFGHGILDIKNRTHAFFSWHRNQDGVKVTSDSIVLHNQYWESETQMRKL